MSVETILHTHTHTHTEAPAHIHILTAHTKFNLHTNRQQPEKTAALNRKHGSCIVSEEEVLKLDLKESREILMSERKGKVILCPGAKVCYEESGGWDYQKQSEKYGRVCKAEVEKRGGFLIRVVFKQKAYSASDDGMGGGGGGLWKTV